ncbi:carbohydrate sulfotransferase 10-like [Eriocheir sinensis]|uniref:carbohydrate sulfotransferase 10-like n=1 Tax=Eriocheir sinensis TaxID=95602 RepID=UPI0021C56729|nr:carbohydrate sulfotransferase 10-like [Eriocheir sinensis]
MEPHPARPRVIAATCAMLTNMRSWMRYLLYVAAVLLSVSLWMAKYNELKTNPKATYILLNPQPRAEGLLNVPVHLDNDSSHTSNGATSRHRTGKEIQKQQTESSYSSESFSPTDTSPQGPTAGRTTPRSHEVDESFMREREKVYQERRQRVQAVCKQLGATGSYGSVRRAPLHRLRWLSSHRLVMCFNAKVGTTTWTQYLLERKDPSLLKRTQNWHNTAKRVLKPPYERDSPEALAMMNDFGKIMIVRHPFVRLVSAYLDKMRGTEFLGLRRRIVAQFRSVSSSSNSSSPSNSSSSTSPLHPTFVEFVRFLIAKTPPGDDVTTKRLRGSKNVHWAPFHVNCAPCDIDYDVILNMETINEDTRYVSERFRLGLQEGVWKNRAKTNSTEVTALGLFKVCFLLLLANQQCLHCRIIN